MTVTLRPGEAPLADWRAIWRGAPVALDPPTARRSRRAPRRSSASSPRRARLWDQHRLRQARRRADRSRRSRDAAAQHRAVACRRRRRGDARSPIDAADDGAEARAASPRAPPACRPETLDCIDAMLARGVTPVVPSQGSVGASGDLAPLAHMAAAMIGVGEARSATASCRRPKRSPRAGLEPLALRPKEGLALLNGTQFSTAHALVGLFEAETLLPLGAGRPARCRSTPRAAPTRRSTRASMRCAATAARSRRRRPCARSSPAARSAPRTASAIRGFRTPIACAASPR